MTKSKMYIHAGGSYGVMDIIVGNEHGDQSSKPGQSCLHCTKTLINPASLTPTIGKMKSRLGMVTCLREGQFWIQTC